MSDLQIQDLPNGFQEGDGYRPIEPQEVTWPEQTPDDLTALKEVVQNVSIAEGWLNSRLYVRNWIDADQLFYAKVDPAKWPGTDKLRSNLGMPLVAEHLFSILSAVQEGLFSGLQPVQIDPRPHTSSATARANQALVLWELEQCGPFGGSFKQELVSVVFDALLYGTGVGFWGWETKTRTKKKRVRSKEADENGKYPLITETITDELNLPRFEYVPLRTLLVDPQCRRSDIRTGKWVARRVYMTAAELDQLRENYDGFENIPTREQLVLLTTPTKDAPQINPLESSSTGLGVPNHLKAMPRWMESTVDPLSKNFEVIQYWTRDRVIWVLEKKLVIRNTTHEFGRIPFVSVAFNEAPDAFMGVGLAMLIGDYQRVMQGTVNFFLDDLSLELNSMYVNKKGTLHPQSIWAAPGKVVTVDDPNSFKPLQRQPVGADALGMIAACQGWAQRSTGANDISVQGSMPAQKSSITRTATGANVLAGGAQSRNQRFIDQLADLVIVPVVEAFIEMNSENLNDEQVRMILSDELGHAYEEDPLNIINGNYKVTISAASRLQARQALNAILPTLVQMLTSPTMQQGLNQQGIELDYTKVAEKMIESTGYPGAWEFIKPMSPESLQRMKDMNPAMNKMKVDQAKIQQEAESQIELESAKVGGRALNTILRHHLEHEDDQAAGGEL